MNFLRIYLIPFVIGIPSLYAMEYKSIQTIIEDNRSVMYNPSTKSDLRIKVEGIFLEQKEKKIEKKIFAFVIFHHPQHVKNQLTGTNLSTFLHNRSSIAYKKKFFSPFATAHPTPNQLQEFREDTNWVTSNFMPTDGHVMGTLKNPSSTDTLKDSFSINRFTCFNTNTSIFNLPLYTPQRVFENDPNTTDIAQQTFAGLIVQLGIRGAILWHINAHQNKTLENRKINPLVIPVSEAIKALDQYASENIAYGYKTIMNTLDTNPTNGHPIYLEVNPLDGETLRKLHNKIMGQKEIAATVNIKQAYTDQNTIPWLTELHHLLYDQKSAFLKRANNPKYYKYFLWYALALKMRNAKEVVFTYDATKNSEPIMKLLKYRLDGNDCEVVHTEVEKISSRWFWHFWIDDLFFKFPILASIFAQTPLVQAEGLPTWDTLNVTKPEDLLV